MMINNKIRVFSLGFMLNWGGPNVKRIVFGRVIELSDVIDGSLYPKSNKVIGTTYIVEDDILP